MLVEMLPPPSEQEKQEGGLRLALLGRPNVGKSSLVNALCGQERMIVSEQAGTTRDSVDVRVEKEGVVYTFVDTSGVRRPSRITDAVESFSVNSAIKTTTKTQITLFLLDAIEGVTQQDKRLLDLLHERKTPFVVLVNKMDMLREPSVAKKTFRQALEFCPHVPVLFISALKKRGLEKILPLAMQVHGECGLRVGTGLLNRAVKEVLDKHQPPVVRRLRAKFFYLTQAESNPPTFVFFVNDAERVPQSYARYLEKSLRRLFGIAHAPMRLRFRSSHKK
jgi:GTP-binding protein